MSEYIKGPWEVWNGDGIRSKVTGQYIVYYSIPYETMGVNGEANAHLIAAAPELLEALKEFFYNIHSDCGVDGCYPCKLARQAIAKAEGK